jgi:hypothetical protein
MDDTSRGVGDEAMRGRGEETTRDYRDTQGTPGAAGRPAADVRVERTPASAARDTGPSAEADEDTTRRTREIRAEIEQTREEMSETIDAIQEKLRPGNIVSEATERVKSATTERVRNMMGSASDTAQGAMEQGRQYADEFMQGGRSRAIPIAMIGAGAAWLLLDRFRDRGHEYRGGREYRGPYGRQYERYDESGEDYAAGASASRRSEAGYESEYGRPYRGSRGRALTSRAGETASQARERAMRATRRTRNRLQRMMNDNPLLVGAAAIMLGAALGMALPETEAENEWMGEAKDTVVDRAQDMARTAASRAQDAAGEVAGEVASRVVSGKDTSQ